MEQESRHQYINLSDREFPVIIDENVYYNAGGRIFNSHWHQQLEFLFYLEGEAIIHCENKSFHVRKDDLVIINGNERHYEESITSNLKYYCIIVDISFFNSRYIYFKNLINDPEILGLIRSVIRENITGLLGFEHAVKGFLNLVFANLIRYYLDRVLSPEEYIRKIKNAKRLDIVLKYLEDNYTSEISIEKAAAMINMSSSHFCHVFKEATGKSLGRYLNHLRINASKNLLLSTGEAVTDIAYATGYKNINYFGRVFKEHTGFTPTQFRKGLLKD